MSNSRVLSTSRNSEPKARSFVKDFLALIKIGIVNSNLVTTFTGFWLAFQFTDRHFLQDLDIMVYTLIGSAFIIAGSGAMNNYIDQDIDPVMKRTKSRPTVTGRFSPWFVMTVALFLLFVGEILLFKASYAAGVWGLAGIISYVVLYSMWAKRKLVSNTIVGSISGAIPPVIGWAAVDPSLGIEPFALFCIMFAWQPPHFYALAMKRTEEYRKAGIPMLPVVKGFDRTRKSMLFWVMLLCPLPFLLMKLGAGFIILATVLNLGWLVLALKGFKAKDDLKWANKMFVYSLNYMTILFVSMIIFSVLS
ncbi:protoheme IX farnesyltransferase [Rummeliibacillus sp. TYF005]|uniref:heme o synthase n=1 Tax=Rummeliibacillus sp. TYF005 TaxID=2058214 RepID=UPI000F544150|nr:heme o synthase [Rummeliibacillus sp. TYF005]RPJ94095.1 protoheme IX farnesyltransferase [Rummeliibacillus sp. TYF005]